MAVEAVSQFLQKVTEDQSLQAELVQAMQAENDREAVTQLGNENGFDFTSEELWAEVQKRQAEFEQRQAAGELTDEELEAISGGTTPLVTTIAVLTVVTMSIGTIGAATW
jgi:predicted ribosomally synthesized peptide with nif11-like leader